jgi:hypothetical protein
MKQYLIVKVGFGAWKGWFRVTCNGSIVSYAESRFEAEELVKFEQLMDKEGL